jgi:hypothetical protein
VKIVFRAGGVKLTKVQRGSLETRLGFVLARFDQRIKRVTIRMSEAEGVPGYKRCQLEIGVDDELVTAEHSDINITLALEHAATRAARSVSRAIEKASWLAAR